jgi:hypothetical protein
MGVDCDIRNRDVQRGMASEERRDFSHPQADAFAGNESERKNRPASFEMTGGGESVK